MLSEFLETRRANALGGGGPYAIPISDATAIKIGAVFSATRIIAETIASLPVDVFERSADGRDVETKSHPLAALLQQSPTNYMTPFTWHECRVMHQLRFGDSFCPLVVDQRTNEVVDLTVIDPQACEAYRSDERDQYGRRTKRYRWNDGDRSRDVDASMMLHVTGVGSDGFQGKSVVRLAAGTASVAAAGERLAASMFRNGAKPSLIVSYPGELGDTGLARLRNQVEKQQSGDNVGRPLVLEFGATASQNTMPLADAQLLELTKFSGEEIVARWFRLPPHVSGYLDRAHFQNVEALDRYFAVHSLRPYVMRDEQAMNATLFRPRDRGRFYVRRNMDALLRGDIKTRYEAHRIALFGGWRTVNEVRELEDLPPVDGGDELPKPAAIWGKQDTKPAAAPKPPSESTETTPNAADNPTETEQRAALRDLIGDAIRGQFRRELAAFERNAGRADGHGRLEDFYRDHVTRLADRFAETAIDPGPILAATHTHRRRMLDAIQERDCRTVIDTVTADFDAEAERLADHYLTSWDVPE